MLSFLKVEILTVESFFILLAYFHIYPALQLVILLIMFLQHFSKVYVRIPKHERWEFLSS